MSAETDTQRALMNELATQARVSKGDLLKVERIQEFDLTGFDKLLVFKDASRVAFPGKIALNAFDIKKLLTGLIAGDFVESDRPEITAYYPHIREGQLLAITTFTMTLDDAKRLLVLCAKELGVTSIPAIQAGVRSYSTGISYFREADWQLHEKDIAESLTIDLEKE